MGVFIFSKAPPVSDNTMPVRKIVTGIFKSLNCCAAASHLTQTSPKKSLPALSFSTNILSDVTAP